MDSNYANEAESVASKGENWLQARSKVAHRAIVLDVDDTTLTTWNYELYSNWDFNPTTNGVFVGLTSGAFTGNMFPATPGMLDLVNQAKADGYAIFWITGRGDSQHQATVANLQSDTAAGLPDITSVTLPTTPGTVPPRTRSPRSTPATRRPRRSPLAMADSPTASSPSRRSAPYPAYLDTPEFCGPSITAGVSCPTIQYKSGTRAYIESQGYDIVGDFGDQFSDLLGGYADKTFKMPNPNYYLP